MVNYLAQLPAVNQLRVMKVLVPFKLKNKTASLSAHLGECLLPFHSVCPVASQALLEEQWLRCSSRMTSNLITHTHPFAHPRHDFVLLLTAFLTLRLQDSVACGGCLCLWSQTVHVMCPVLTTEALLANL